MPGLESILTHVPGFALVLARLTGLFLFSPILASASVPRRVKTLLALALAMTVYPTIDHAFFAGATLRLFDLAPMLAMELLIGASIGVLMLTPLWGVQLAGTLMGQQMGLSLAPIYNPAADIEGDSLGQLLFMMALAVFISAGGVELMWDGVVHSFAAVPAGGFRADGALLHTVAGLLDSGFHLALRVSMPVMAIVLVESVAVGFVSKTLPTLNLMSFGFPLRIMLGMAALTAALAGISGALGDEVRATLGIVSGWATSLGNP